MRASTLSIQCGQLCGCVLSFCSDGANFYKSIHIVYSMWPIMLSLLNLPIPLRKSVGGILLVGIVPGNRRKEVNNLTPYLDILVDKLLVLSECHNFHPAYMKAPVNINVKLLQYVLDFPAIGKILQQSAAGAIKVCLLCEIQGRYCFSLKKTLYRDGRRYLEQEDKLRIMSTFSSSEDREKPAALSVLKEKYRSSKFDKIEVVNKPKLFIKGNSVKGAYSFMKLPYHKFHRDDQSDGMHTVTDVVKTVMNWLAGNVDINKLRQAKEEFKLVRPEKIVVKIVTLTVKEKKIGNHRCRSLMFPKEFSGFLWIRFQESHGDTKKHTWMDCGTFFILSFSLFAELLSCLLNKNTISK